MRSHARLLKHPLHPMLVMFPTAIFPMLLVVDAVHLWSGDAGAWTVGFWLAAAGVATTLAAMVPGLIDLAKIPDESRAHKVAVFHVVVGVATLVAYAAATWVRWPIGVADSFALAVGIDVVGVAIISLQGWLGGELVYKHHLGVETPEEGAEPTPFTTSTEEAKRRPVPSRRDV